MLLYIVESFTFDTYTSKHIKKGHWIVKEIEQMHDLRYQTERTCVSEIQIA